MAGTPEPRVPRWLRWKWGGGVVYAAASAGSRVTRSRSPYVSSCRPEEPHPMESEIRARSNSLGCPRLPRLTSPRAWWHQTSPTSPDDGGDFHTTRVGSERAHALLRQPRHGSRAWYCPFTLASGSDPRHESRVALLARTPSGPQVSDFSDCFLLVFGQLAVGGLAALAVPPFAVLQRGFYKSSACVFL